MQIWIGVVVAGSVAGLLWMFQIRYGRKRAPTQIYLFKLKTELKAASNWGAFTRLKSWYQAGRLQKDYKLGLARFLESAARSMRSGSTLQGAVLEAADGIEASAADPLMTDQMLIAPLIADLNKVKVKLAAGAGFEEAMLVWAKLRPLPELAKVTAALTFGLSSQLGGKRGQSLERLAAGLKAEVALTEEIYSLATQARVSAVSIAVMPIGFLLISASFGGGVLGFLLTTPIGIVCLLLGLGLDVLGAVWMKRIMGNAFSF